jgi:hypothetical protein
MIFYHRGRLFGVNAGFILQTAGEIGKIER